MADAKQTADQICNLLRDFIPPNRYSAACDCIAEFMHKEGLELTSRLVRSRYEVMLENENPNQMFHRMEREAKLTLSDRPGFPVT